MKPWLKALRTLFTRPAFLLVTLVLLACAIGINGATAALRLHFQKQAMPLRSAEGLSILPKKIGNWVSVPEQHTIDPDMVHNLQTDKYLFREYINTGAKIQSGEAPTPAKITALGDLPPKDRMIQVDRYRTTIPNGVLNLAVTYYTGKVDTVPHVPDRCYVADGFQPSTYKVQTWNLGTYGEGAKKGKDREVPVRFIDFEDQTPRGALNRCVAYFFHANGDYEHDPNKVRARLQDLFERCAYFTKIEVMIILVPRVGADGNDAFREQDRQDAAAAMQEFLKGALPEIEKMLPDWEARPK